jgi:hypothetical protein
VINCENSKDGDYLRKDGYQRRMVDKSKPLVEKELMNCIALASFTHTHTAVLALSALGPEYARFEECREIAASPPEPRGSQLPTPSVRVGNVSLSSV